MMRPATQFAQRGATLVIGMIILVLITLFVVSGFTLSTMNLKAVGNMQFRDEAIAASNIAIEQIISSDFTSLPVAATVLVDIDQNGTDDYEIDVAAPVCIQAAPVAVDPSTLSGVTSGVTTSSDYNTVWEIVATVDTVNSAQTGAAVTVRQGVRKRLTQAQYNTSDCI